MPNYTIYISTTNDRHFQSEENKGGLINELLELHYTEPDKQVKMAAATAAAQKKLNAQINAKHDAIRHELGGANYVPDRTIEGVGPAPAKNKKAKTSEKPGLTGTVHEIAVDYSEDVPITQKNKDMKFCKHGAVVGFCKKGCK